MNFGNVGIGTASPTYELDVAGNASISGSLGIGGMNPTSSYGINATSLDDGNKDHPVGGVKGSVNSEYSVFGVLGYDGPGAGKQYGVYGVQGGGSYAGYFEGDVEITGDLYQSDNDKHYFGTGDDASIYWDGTNNRLVIEVT